MANMEIDYIVMRLALFTMFFHIHRLQAEPIVGCYPDTETAQKCTMKECMWQDRNDGARAPQCQVPQGVSYRVVRTTRSNTGVHVELNKPVHKLYVDSPAQLHVEVNFLRPYMVRMRIYDNVSKRYEVPQAALDTARIEATRVRASETVYEVEVSDTQFDVAIRRKSTNETVFNTGSPGLQMLEQYGQITIALPSDYVYGLGEHNHEQFRHDMNWRTWTIFTRDAAPVGHGNLYGAHPFYMNLEEDGSANGVFLKNSNAMDVVLQPKPNPAITYRISGGLLDFFIFLGPTPEEVVQQYTEFVGRPAMPPYWSLGLHLSRWNYGSLAKVRRVVQRNIDARIPFDVVYGDIDYMHKKMDFTYDRKEFEGLPGYTKELDKMGLRYIVILDPAISDDPTLHRTTAIGKYGAYTDGIEQNVFIKKSKSDVTPIQGKVWPGTTVYPDFTSPNATAYWQKWCKYLHNDLGIRYSALWIDMNEPSNFVWGSTVGCENNKWNHPPYLPKVDGGKMYAKTICMDSWQNWGMHYDVHNLYGHSQSQVTYKVLEQMFPEKRPLVLTRSTFSGTSKWASHWLGDNQSRWPQMKWSIVGMLEFSLFGFPFTGADICGFWFNTTEELCNRWMQLGSFYPYARNHNGLDMIDQDPAAFSPETVKSARTVLRIRYKLLPYLYTLMYFAHTKGNTVVRPLMHEFPTDKLAKTEDTSFLWGAGILIAPILDRKMSRSVYLPSGTWYYYHTREIMKGGHNVTIQASKSIIPLFIRGGNIIPWQQPSKNTKTSRVQPMGLTVAVDTNGKAEGQLFWDDGEGQNTIKEGEFLLSTYVAKSGQLTISVNTNSYRTNLKYKTIEILDITHKANCKVVADGRVMPYKFSMQDHAIEVSVDMDIDKEHTLTWSCKHRSSAVQNYESFICALLVTPFLMLIIPT